MKIKIHHVALAALTTVFCSCVGTSVKHTWKSPDYHGGPVKKVAVVAADPRAMVQQVFEGQFVTQLEQSGLAGFETRGLMTIADMKANKEAAAARFLGLGADSVLIVRLVSSKIQTGSGRQPSSSSGGVTFGADSNGWFDIYWVAYSPPTTSVASDLQQDVYLDTSLYDLKTGKRLWSALTETVMTESTDRLEMVRPLVAKVMAAMRQDGFTPYPRSAGGPRPQRVNREGRCEISRALSMQRCCEPGRRPALHRPEIPGGRTGPPDLISDKPKRVL